MAHQYQKQDAGLRDRLKPLYRKYKYQKYLVTVFLSGTQELASTTIGLLCYNRKRISQLEMEWEKRGGMVMGL